MEPSSVNLSHQHIVQAFRVISNPLNSPQSISQASEYLNKCQQSPHFALTLIKLYSSSSQPFIQLQSILLLLNIIKRNWQSKRGRGWNEQSKGFEAQKPVIRKQLLSIYPLYNLQYVKHINQALKFLSRQDYPSKYLQLHEFMVNSLKSLYSEVLNSQQAIRQSSNLIIGLLSTVKIVTKEYASKRLSHSQQTFNTYISQIIKIAFPISEKCHQLIRQMDLIQCQELQVIETLVESAKKIDKIILYCLLCMPNMLQYVSEVQQIFRVLLNNIAVIDDVLLSKIPQRKELSGCFQSYITGVLEQVFKVQSLYPFLLADDLQNYLQLIVKMLIINIPNRVYKSQRLILTIVQANLKVWTCFTYYMTQQQFSGSIYNRKSTNNLELQAKCHKQFLSVFSQQNVAQFLSKLLSEVMVSKSINSSHKDLMDQEMILEESESCAQDTFADSNAYELCILLCKNVVKCFKKQFKPMLEGLFVEVSSMGSNVNDQLKQKVVANTMQLILVLPKIYDQHQLSLQQVHNLLSTLYTSNQFSILARLIKNYQDYLNQSTLQRSFTILSQIVSTPLTNPHVNIDIIYQSALTMKKILSENESDMFSFENFAACVINLLKLLNDQKFTKNPTLMWPLIKLSNQLLKLVNPSVVITQIGQQIIDCIFPIVTSKSQQLTVCGIAQTIQNLLNIICSCFKNNFLAQQPQPVTINKATVKVLYAAYTLIMTNKDNDSLQNVDALYMLWLCLIRNFPTIEQQELYQLNTSSEFLQLNQSLKGMFEQIFDRVLEQDAICAVQILEEYVICELVQLSENQLLGIFQKLLSDCLQQHKVRTYTALFSMYYCYLIVQTQSGRQTPLQQDILKLLIQTLLKYNNQISPQINGLRTLLMIIINYLMIKFGVQNIYNLFTMFCGNNYAKWFYMYCWSGQYVSNRLCHKINSTAYLKALQELGVQTFGNMLRTPIEENYPLDIVLKTMVISLEPMKISQGWITFSNMYKLILPTQSTSSSIGSTTSRKIKLQLSGLIKEILINDQRENYQKLMTDLFTYWDWGQDDIVQRFDKISSNQILMLLKGTYKKDYDINEPD